MALENPLHFPLPCLITRGQFRKWPRHFIGIAMYRLYWSWPERRHAAAGPRLRWYSLFVLPGETAGDGSNPATARHCWCHHTLLHLHGHRCCWDGLRRLGKQVFVYPKWYEMIRLQSVSIALERANSGNVRCCVCWEFLWPSSWDLDIKSILQWMVIRVYHPAAKRGFNWIWIIWFNLFCTIGKNNITGWCFRT